MVIFRRNQSMKLVVVALIAIGLITTGCGSSSKNNENTPATNTSSAVKSQPKIRLGLPSTNVSYLPFYVAEKKELFKKYNLEVESTTVQGGVIALRGLQTGDFQIISSLPESVITGVAEGANVKLIGTLDDHSMYSIFVTSDIKSSNDLKGKVAATNRPGNGTDIQLRWWLNKNGLLPDKDIRIVEAGENSGRLQALITGQAQVTILSQPTDLKAEAVGMKRLALMRDDLKTYNHNMIVANGDFLKKQPEAARAFMAAEAEAVEYIKNPANKDEIVQLLMEKLEMKKEEATKSIDFVLPGLANKGKMNLEGVKWAIDTTKETGALKSDLALDKLIDESYYAK
jgi:NitT/TauT family transport system substrate-binding protein